MKMQYGDMVIEVDPVTHRARRVLETGGVRPPLVVRRRQTDGYDSKLEDTRARELELERLAGEIRAWRYHPFTVTIGVRRTYTPDFLVVPIHGPLRIEEIKGSLRAKNARDSVTRLHAAAAQLPMLDWVLLVQEGRRGGWKRMHVRE